MKNMQKRLAAKGLHRAAALLLSAALLVTGMSFEGLDVTAEGGAALPVWDTDVAQGGTDTMLIGISGTYVDQISEALDLINSYRKEACDNGYPDPNTGSTLTPSDYVPIQWSEGLEYIARIRAAESSQTVAHTRTNGTRWSTLSTPGGYRSYGECLAWNWSSDMVQGIQQWYEEKSDYLNNTGGVTGHYTSMIAPSNRYVGMGTFCTSSGRYYNTTCAEYNGSDDSESFSFDYTSGIQKVEVPSSDVTLQSETLGETFTVGESRSLQLAAEYSGKTGFTLEDTVSWSTSDETVMRIDGDQVTAVGAGSATLTAETNSLIYTIEVTAAAAETTTTTTTSATTTTTTTTTTETSFTTASTAASTASGTETAETLEPLTISLDTVALTLEELKAADYQVRVPISADHSYGAMEFGVTQDSRLTYLSCTASAGLCVPASQGDFHWCTFYNIGAATAGEVGYFTFQLPEDTAGGDWFALDATTVNASGTTARWTRANSGIWGEENVISGGILILDNSTTETTVSSTETVTTTTTASTADTAATSETTGQADTLTVSVPDMQISLDELRAADYVVEVPIYADRGYSTLSFGISCASGMTYVNSEALSGMCAASERNGFIWWTNSVVNGTAAGQIGTVQLRLSEDAAAGAEYAVTLTAVNAAGGNGRWLDAENGQRGVPQTVSGVIRITDGQQTTEAPVEHVFYGDVNVDGKVDVADAVLLNKAVAGAVLLNTQQRSNGDCDGSGELNASDALTLLKFLVQTITTLPYQE